MNRQFAPATLRNREPILAVLKPHLQEAGLVLEIASGSGEHAAWFAPRLPGLLWQPSDRDEAAQVSIRAWREETAADNLLEPVALDVVDDPWPVAAADVVVCINMVHISPWAATRALMAGAARTLPPGGLLYLYGPYQIGGEHTADSNRAFDESLKGRNPDWGIRDLADVAAEAAAHGLVHAETVAMPANNQSVIIRRN